MADSASPASELTPAIGPMRRNPSTVVVLAGPAPAEVLAAVGRSMNVTLIRPEEPVDSGGDGAPYALVPADPLAPAAASWRAMWAS